MISIESMLIILTGDMLLVVRLGQFGHTRTIPGSRLAIEKYFLYFWGGSGHQKCPRIWPKLAQNIEKWSEMPGNGLG